MKSALLIIDVQKTVLADDDLLPDRRKIVDAAFDKTVERLRQLQIKARAADVPVILVQHDGGTGDLLERGSDGWQIRDEIAPLAGDIVVEKRSADSFYDTCLSAVLAEHGITHLVAGGCMSQYCVDTTLRRAVSLGYDVTLIGDGHTTSDTASLPYDDIVRHHNETLNNFRAGTRFIRLENAADISFAKCD